MKVARTDLIVVKQLLCVSDWWKKVSIAIDCIHVCCLIGGHIELREAIMVEGGCGVWKVHPVNEDIYDALVWAVALVHL